MFGAIYTLIIQYKYTQTQCEDGARDVRVLWLTPVSLQRIEKGNKECGNWKKNHSLEQNGSNIVFPFFLIDIISSARRFR